MRAWTACLAVLSACGFATQGPDGGGGEDAPGSVCFGTSPRICFPTGAPTTLVTFPDSPQSFEINTGDGLADLDRSLLCDLSNDSASKYCVIASTSLTVQANHTLHGVGSRPLVLISTSSIVIEASASVDVASRGSERGAGATAPGCASTEPASDSYSGGSGGSFGGRGGNGEMNDGPAGMASGPLPAPPQDLRGGCPGATGGTKLLANGPGPGGSGGGAVALIAAGTIRLDGMINASGAGGLGGTLSLQSGGGGGGSGGMIVLDAQTIIRGENGSLFANGGGGGQGAAGPMGNPGEGADGRESTGPTSQGLGGIDNSKDGGSGGNGSTGSARLDGSPGGNAAAVRDGGGGGGGGGAGFIIVRDMTGQRVISGDTVISPPAWPPP